MDSLRGLVERSAGLGSTLLLFDSGGGVENKSGLSVGKRGGSLAMVTLFFLVLGGGLIIEGSSVRLLPKNLISYRFAVK